ncbi:MAG: fibronectin type III domain-containing protein [Lachnospiraceae bacterium]|nr:fibronectin type III domain-containing protein [Lachnospiraceae bacterium]
MKKYVALLFAIVMMIFVLPAMEVQAAAPAAPKDAKQTVSIENGVRVEWTAVTGAKKYYYSFSADGKKYTPESMTGNNGTDNYVNIVNKDVLKPGTFYYVRVRSFDGSSYSTYVEVKVATAPKAPKTIKQIAADSTTVTLSWDASEGASGYMIGFGTTQAKLKEIGTITKTSCKLVGLEPDSKYYVCIHPIKRVTKDFYASQNYVDNPKVVTTAGPVKGLKLYDWDVKSNVVVLQWTNTAKYENGYQIELYKADGKTKIKTYNVSGRKATMKFFSNKKVKNVPFQYRIRTYTTLNGTKCYGEWSAFAYAVPQANVTAVKASNTSVKLKWAKIQGAKSYTIYRATKEGGKYKKVATTKKTSYTVKKLKTYTDYYFLVKANKVKIGGKNRSSSKLSTSNDINVFIYKYQDEVCVE